MAAGLVAFAWPLAISIAFAFRFPEGFTLFTILCGGGLLMRSLTREDHLRRVQKEMVMERVGNDPLMKRWIVRCTYRRGLYQATDAGALWRDRDILHFEGLQTNFEIPSRSVQRSMESHRPVRFEVVFEQATYTIDLVSMTDEAGPLRRYVKEWLDSQPYDQTPARLPERYPSTQRVLRPYLLHFFPCAAVAALVGIQGIAQPGQPSVLLACLTAIVAFGWLHFLRRQAEILSRD